MAKLSADKTYVTVQKGDTLGKIAQKYGNGKTYQQLAKENGISNPNKIFIGQKIYLNGKSSTSTTTTAKKDPNITQFGPLPDKEGTLYAPLISCSLPMQRLQVLILYSIAVRRMLRDVMKKRRASTTERASPVLSILI